ncbi:MAG TPA: HNH endonuclease domain-containing protein [Candidatus Acidoferrum sp.]|nr:HNH endonuclease domain-containing protein [Candidatus Acidoferrum sp.]
MKVNESRAEARPLQTQTIKCKKPNAELVWKQVDDELVPRLRLWPIDRAAYCYLVRHSRLEGKVRLRFSMPWLARGIGVSTAGARRAVLRLIDKKALRLIECSLAGRVAEVPLPEEILADYLRQMPSSPGASLARAANLEEEDFLRTPALREAIHAREGGRCFYCLGRLTKLTRCLDHVVPCLRSGDNSYRNLVSCCRDCNLRKGACSAEDYFRSLFRDRQLSAADLAERLRALDSLASGKLPPPLPPAAPHEARPQRKV